jgi:hypothetical protein
LPKDKDESNLVDGTVEHAMT